ncbi:hypothetical protein [Methylomonas koyamae]|uniref:hypothetical protein n=1 Tax=Methylomonas koyamae TaxID=702114 RepID=UPI0006D2C9C8|nr:hypothetical protein [Methylomonas koyamae]BBL57707.1 hypothetical protein MKFW12EY_13200 [Methylomonas koyamae]
MPFVRRGADGTISGVSAGGGEWLAADDPEWLAYAKLRFEQDARQALSDTDSEMVRVIDDLVDLLVAKQVLIFTELPERVQSKLLARKQLRNDMNALQNPVVDDEALF